MIIGLPLLLKVLVSTVFPSIDFTLADGMGVLVSVDSRTGKRRRKKAAVLMCAVL
jgi:hypothetical protein